jgi:hypothetical protein
VRFEWWARAACSGTGLRFSRMRHGSGDESDESDEHRLKRQAELGRLLAAAEGYRVVASDSASLGWLDHVRYQKHADHPDEIVVRGRRLLRWRRCALPFSAVEAVRQRERTVVVRLDRIALERLLKRPAQPREGAN